MINKKFKDRLFCKLFGDASNKANALSLYNALCNTSYSDIDNVVVYTIEDVVYMGMKNDVAILIDSYLSLWEQQSTFNPNMPLRGFLYFGKMYDKYIETLKLNVYGSTLIKIPTPQYKVFYCGDLCQPARTKLRLSDAFMSICDKGDFEWTAEAINLNWGCNEELLDKCKPLRDYATFVNKVKELSLIKDIESAVEGAVEYCIENDILRAYLVKNRAEVKDMCITEFNEKEFIESIRSEGFEQGIARGINQGIKRGIKQGKILNLMSLVKQGILSVQIASREAGMPEKDFTELMKEEYNISSLV